MSDDVATDKKKKGLPWWGWALIAVVAFGALSNAFGGGDDSPSVQTEAVETSDSQESTAAESEEAPAAEEAESFPDETVGEENARKSADSYLSFSAFSRSGLIDQLLFEGFSQAEAEYGVDALGADWNEQAAKSAESYLEFSSFSRQGLIDQLVFEGFSQAEAEYGVSQNGF